MRQSDENSLPIGIFDSGVGGLTVLKAIREQLPAENLVYLGDTARLPYGTKSPSSIERYALQATAKLQQQDIKLLVVACNTASAVALQALRRHLHPIPVLGVVEPGAAAATRVRMGGLHWVLATEATVRLEAYRKAITALDPHARVHEHACELLVSLAEEGWTDGDIADAIVRRYLSEAAIEWGHQSAKPDKIMPDTIILGCTHFPLLRDIIASVAVDDVTVVDSATTTAQFVLEQLQQAGRLNVSSGIGTLRLMATDGVSRFARVGGRFLGEPLSAEDVALVDL